MKTERIAVRCPSCQLNQFLTEDKLCRKCGASLVTPELVAVETSPGSPGPLGVMQTRENFVAKLESILAEAAHLLGVSKNTLYRRLHRYTKIKQEVRTIAALAKKPCVSVVVAPQRSVVMDKDLAGLYEELVARGVLLRDTIAEKKLS